MKEKVDDAIVKCGSVTNILNVLVGLKTEYDAVEDASTKAIVKDKATQILQTYFTMILFASYIDKNSATEYEKTFQAWMAEQDQAELVDLLGTKESGALADFEWV